jgi:DNA-binding MarR family transcriptional regulator
MNEHALTAAHKFWEVFPAVMRATIAEARRGTHNLTPAHYRILRALSNRDCTVSELAQHQDVSLPSISETVQTLVERGWLERETSPEDRRVNHVRITRKGQQVLSKEQKRLVGWMAARLDSLKPSEVLHIEQSLVLLLELFGNNAVDQAAIESKPQTVKNV